MKVTRGALVAHRYTYTPPRSTTIFLFLSVSIWNDLDLTTMVLVDAVFDGVGLACVKSRANAILLA